MRGKVLQGCEACKHVPLPNRYQTGTSDANIRYKWEHSSVLVLSVLYTVHVYYGPNTVSRAHHEHTQTS